jgi:hypothetical protein
MKRIIKKTDYCSNCVFLDINSYCRKGLGWKHISHPEYTLCKDQWPIRPRRCGTCRWFSLDITNRFTGHCSLDKEFRNWYEFSCNAYFYESGKNLKPNPDPIPERFKNFI